MKLPFLCLTFLVHFSYNSFAQVHEAIDHRFYNSFEDPLLNKDWINPATVTNGDDSTKNHFSRTDKTNPYSSGIEIEVPSNLKRSNFRITVNGLIRVSTLEANNQLVIAVSSSDSAIFWKGYHVPDSTGKVKEWNHFSISCLVPRNIPKDSKAKIFIWNADGKSETDIDDLEIIFKEIEFPSSLPK